MSSAVWLLLYLAPLLGLTAAVFAWFGYQWRRHDMQQRIKDLAAEIHALQAKLQVNSAPVPVQSESELVALREQLAAAQSAASQRENDALKAHQALETLEQESAQLLRDLDLLRNEQDQTSTTLAAVKAELIQLRNQPSAVQPTAGAGLAKPKRQRQVASKTKITFPATLRDTITALESRLSAHQASIAALIQERDDWQRRVVKLEATTPSDPAGLALARRSLADSSTRLLTASNAIERLHKQTEVLLRAEQKAAAISHVPDDDLTQIKGIKTVINNQLRAHDIRTWRQIAQWDAEELSVFSELLAFKNRAIREKWQDQARTLHQATHGVLPDF